MQARQELPCPRVRRILRSSVCLLSLQLVDDSASRWRYHSLCASHHIVSGILYWRVSGILYWRVRVQWAACNGRSGAGMESINGSEESSGRT